MNSQLIGAIFIALIGVISIFFSLIVFTKNTVLKTDKFHVFRDFTPLPDVVNYFIFKLFILISGTIASYLGIYGIVNNM
ncbi:hypothetical protein LG326_01845 [Metaplanococcus flavidus]